MEYNYTFTLKLRCAAPIQTGSFKEHETWLRLCANKFNEICKKSSTNRKKVEIIEVKDDLIEVVLYSEVNLGKAPGRSLTMLSKTLIDDKNILYDPYFSEQLFHGKLFTIEVIEAEVGEFQLSDGELIKCLVDYGISPKSSISEKEKRAVEQMKKLAIESGLFKIQNLVAEIK